MRANLYPSFFGFPPGSYLADTIVALAVQLQRLLSHTKSSHDQENRREQEVADPVKDHRQWQAT
jgi:hypothetical protein